MSHRIVDVLEPVEVDVDERDLSVRALGVCDLALQAIFEELPVWQASQTVVVRLLEQGGAALFATKSNRESPGECSRVTCAIATRLRIGEQQRAANVAFDFDGQPVQQLEIAVGDEPGQCRSADVDFAGQCIERQRVGFQALYVGCGGRPQIGSTGHSPQRPIRTTGAHSEAAAAGSFPQMWVDGSSRIIR